MFNDDATWGPWTCENCRAEFPDGPWTVFCDAPACQDAQRSEEQADADFPPSDEWPRGCRITVRRDGRYFAATKWVDVGPNGLPYSWTEVHWGYGTFASRAMAMAAHVVAARPV